MMVYTKEQLKANKRRYYLKHKEEIARKGKENYNKNKEKILERNKKWKDKNRDEMYAKQKEYYEINNKKVLLKAGEYRENNRLTIREKDNKRYKDNRIKVYIKNSNLEVKARKKESRRNRGEKGREYQRNYYIKNREKALTRALSKNLIKLKESCEICGSTEGLQRHHWNYAKPLLVNTLCKTCHEIQHTKDFYNSKFSPFVEVIPYVK